MLFASGVKNIWLVFSVYCMCTWEDHICLLKCFLSLNLSQHNSKIVYLYKTIAYFNDISRSYAWNIADLATKSTLDENSPIQSTVDGNFAKKSTIWGGSSFILYAISTIIFSLATFGIIKHRDNGNDIKSNHVDIINCSCLLIQQNRRKKKLIKTHCFDCV